MLQRGFLRKGALGPEEGNFYRLLQRETGRHDLTKQPSHIFIAQGTRIAIHNMAQHLRFSFRLIVGLVALIFFDFCNLLRTTRTLTDSMHNLQIECINFVSKTQQWIIV